MNIVFRGPVFYSQEDETVFFNWFQSLPEYNELVGEVRNLHLSIQEPVSETTIVQLLTIFKRWNISIELLENLKTKENQNHSLWY